jgi:fatty-acid desaturase
MTVSTFLWALLAAFVLAQISSFCTTIYLHRGVTHSGVKLHPVVAYLMHGWLWLLTGIVPRATRTAPTWRGSGRCSSLTS